MSPLCHSSVLVCHSYVTRMYSYVTRMYSYVLVCYPCGTRTHSYVIRKSLLCTCMSPVCHSYALVCNPYLTRNGFTMNHHSPSHSHLPYLVALILHGHSTLLSVSLFSQSRLWKLTTYECS